MSPTRRPPSIASVDFDVTPFIAIWETTRACDLACRHCRAEAQPFPLPGELTTKEGFELLDELADGGVPICVLSGGDPAKRADLFSLIEHGARRGMRMATIPAATTRLTRELVQSLKDAGLSQMALSLDGSTAELHDGFRRTPGAFEKTLQGIAYAGEVGLPLQINTVFGAHNKGAFGSIRRLIEEIQPVFWEVFFLVPMGRGTELGQMQARDFEDLFRLLAKTQKDVDFIVKITEAPHYRRYVMQQHREKQKRETKAEKGVLATYLRRDVGPGGSIGLSPKGVNAGKGHLFVSYCGDIYPSGFLPRVCGNVREDSLREVYRNHPVFRELLEPERLKGKCGICEFRDICGGSRARAYAMTGDYLEEEPFCAYQPRMH